MIPNSLVICWNWYSELELWRKVQLVASHQISIIRKMKNWTQKNYNLSEV